MTNVDLKEKLGNLGYLAIKKEAVKGTAVIPDVFIPLYEEDIAQDIHLDEDSPVVGIREARFKVYRGQESITGNVRVLAEPKTIGHFFNMLLYKANETGSGTPTTGYTHSFSLSGLPKSYTFEFLKGNIPVRLVGVEARSITPAFEDNKMVLEVAISAREQFSIAKLVSATGTPTGTVVLNDSERLNPTSGLVVGDSLRLYDVSSGTYEDVAISAINADGKTLSTGGISGTYGAGDLCYLKPLTPSISIDEPFNWAMTQFRLASDITAALTATPTALEKDSNWVIRYDMEEEGGAMRSGSYYPSNFVRTTGDIEISLKKFFDDGSDLDRFLQVGGRAMAIEHTSPSLAGTNGTRAKLTIKVNEFYIRNHSIPLKSNEIIYSEIELAPVYNSDDAQMFSVDLLTSVDKI